MDTHDNKVMCIYNQAGQTSGIKWVAEINYFVSNINFAEKIIPRQDNPQLWGKFRSIALDMNLAFFA